MKKYIRTEDGRIISLSKKDEIIGFELRQGRTIIHFLNRRNVTYTAQSDSIEELCDVFVKKSSEPGNPYFEIGDDTVLERKFENYKKHFEHYNYYGAVWTDKGLIYVAEMNEEGEFELL